MLPTAQYLREILKQLPKGAAFQFGRLIFQWVWDQLKNTQ